MMKRWSIALWLFVICLQEVLAGESSPVESSVPSQFYLLDDTYSLGYQDAFASLISERQRWLQELRKARQPVDFDLAGEGLQDSILGGGVFRAPWQTRVSFGLNEGRAWLLVDLRTFSSFDSGVLRLNNPLLERVECFTLDARGALIERGKSGVGVAHGQKRLQHYDVSWPIDFERLDQRPRWLLVSMDGRFPLKWRLSFDSVDRFQSAYVIDALGIAFYLGMIAVMILYCLVLFIYIKDISYLYQLLAMVFLHALALPSTQAAYSVWPGGEWPALMVPFFHAVSLIGVFWSSMFARNFLETRVHWPRLDRVLHYASLLLLILVVLPFGRQAPMLFFLLVACIFFLVVAYVYISLSSARLRAGNGLTFFTAWGLLIAFGGYYLLSFIGWLPESSWSRYGLFLGAAMQVFLLSIALAQRLESMRVERNTAQQAVVQAQRNKQSFQNALLNHLSQGFRNPLNSIQNTLYALEKAFESDSVQGWENMIHVHRTNIHLASGASEQLHGMVDDLLELSRIDEDENSTKRQQLVPVEFFTLCRSMLKLLAHRRQEDVGEMVRIIAPAETYVLADPELLGRVMYHLLENAVRYGQASDGRQPCVSVKIEVVEDQKAALGKSKAKNKAISDELPVFFRFSVCDSGSGLDEKFHRAVFGQMRSVVLEHTRGLRIGIGLILCRLLLRRLGSELEYRAPDLRSSSSSSDLSGAEFSFRLQKAPKVSRAVVQPLSALDAEWLFGADHSSASAQPEGAQLGDWNANEQGSVQDQLSVPKRRHLILVVDQDPLNRSVLVNQLVELGYITIGLTDVASAIAWIAEHRHPDLVMLDIELDHQAGFLACKEFRQSFSQSDIPLILLTTIKRTEELAYGLECGANDYLLKPYRPEEAEVRLRSQLRLKQLAAELEEKNHTLMHVSKLATLGEISASLAHEINNPLQTVMGYTDMVLNEIKQHYPEAWQNTGDQLQAMEHGCQRIYTVTRSLLTSARAQAPEFERASIHAIIQQTVQFLRHSMHTAGIDLILELADEDPYVQGQIEPLQQVFLNLLANSKDALLEQRRDQEASMAALRVVERNIVEAAQEPRRRSKDRRLPRIVIKSQLLADMVRISIEDNGPGMPPAVLEQIFEAFFTTKPVGKGTGLGLSICKRIIEDHTGTLTCESRMGEGTSFFMTLPRHP